MTQTIDVNGDTALDIPREELELAEAAYLGESMSGRIVIHDASGALVVPSHKLITVEQSSSTPSRIASQFSRRKGIARGDVYTVGASRVVRVDTVDPNDLLHRLVIRDKTGSRPAEDVDTRIAWLLTDELSRVSVNDFGAVASSSAELDKFDYRSQYPGDVLGQIAKAIGFNFYVRWNSAESDWELVFRDDNTSTADTCTLSISNVMADVDNSLVFAPNQDAELSEDGEHVYSGTLGQRATGNPRYDRDASTATAFADRDGTTEDAGIRTDTTLKRDNERFLHESSTEEQLLPVTLRLKAAKVGLIQAGMRISTRMTHMAPEGWDPAIYARILRKRITQPFPHDNEYDVHLELSPQEAGPPAPGDCTDIYTNTASATYYPLGGRKPCCTPNDVGTNIAYYFRPGWPDPFVPNPDYSGQWHFPTYGVGGTGTTDYFASGFSNLLRFIVVGNGTLTIQTEQWAGQSQPYTVRAYKLAGAPVPVSSKLAGTAGGSTEITISDATDGDCVRFIDLRADARSSSYIGMGWSQAVWVAA